MPIENDEFYQASWELWEEPVKLLTEMVKMGHGNKGVAKLKPPEGFYEQFGFDIENLGDVNVGWPINQTVVPILNSYDSGVYAFCSERSKTYGPNIQKEMPVIDYFSTSESAVRSDGSFSDDTFWGKVQKKPIPIFNLGKRKRSCLEEEEPFNANYSCENETTYFSPEAKKWQLAQFDSYLTKFGEYFPFMKGDGVSKPYVYYGSAYSFFPWHSEDLNLYSLNFHWGGFPKVWWSIPVDKVEEFEKVMAFLYPHQAKLCKAFLRHKFCLVNPEILEAHGITVYRTVQYPGEFIFTHPICYHSGWNVGKNCCEAVNVGLEDCLQYAQRASRCTCNDKKRKVQVDGHFLRRKAPQRQVVYEKKRTPFEVAALKEKAEKTIKYLYANPLDDLFVTNFIEQQEKSDADDRRLTETVRRIIMFERRRPIGKNEVPKFIDDMKKIEFYNHFMENGNKLTTRMINRNDKLHRLKSR